MKLLTATRLTQGTAAGDEDTGIVPGELVEPMSMCDRDRYNDDLPCGCGRMFRGMTSNAQITTAIIAERDLDYDELYDLVKAKNPDCADPDPDEPDRDVIAEMTEQLLGYGDEYDEGTVVGIYRYEVVGIYRYELVRRAEEPGDPRWSIQWKRLRTRLVAAATQATARYAVVCSTRQHHHGQRFDHASTTSSQSAPIRTWPSSLATAGSRTSRATSDERTPVAAVQVATAAAQSDHDLR